MKNGSNQYFNRWISEVKWAYKNIHIVRDKIKHLESQLCNCNSTVYDSIGSSSSVRNTEEDKVLSILSKIEENRIQVSNYIKIINDYERKKAYLRTIETEVIEHLVETNLNKSDIATTLHISRSKLYKIINRLRICV